MVQGPSVGATARSWPASTVGEAGFEEVFYTMRRRLIERYDAVLRVQGKSNGSDEMVALATERGAAVYAAFADISWAL